MNDLESHFHQLEDSYQSWLITGQAGSGKSTLIRYCSTYSQKKIILLASTGVAAHLINGHTLHAFFGFHPGITEKDIQTMTISKKHERLLAEIDTFFIDEISMVRADWIDCMELFLRRFGKLPHRAFGGYQFVFCGDLFQLPPVVSSLEESIFNSYYSSPYFFSANSFSQFQYAWMVCQENFRQTDHETVRLLQQIREGEITENELKRVNEKVFPLSELGEDHLKIILTSTHAKADAINHERLQNLPSPVHTYSAVIEGVFPVKQYPTNLDLPLAVGAQIMFVSNDPSGRFVNGSLGVVEEIHEYEGSPVITILLEDQSLVRLEREVFTYQWISLNPVTFTLESEAIGRFVQFPVQLAWAITIHKSQGKTFSSVHVDLGKGAFSTGQAYVALSRCRYFNALTLQSPLRKEDLQVDPRIKIFEKQCAMKQNLLYNNENTLKEKNHE